MLNDLLCYFDSNKDKPETGKLVLGRTRELSYGGDLYAYSLLRINADKSWYGAYSLKPECQPRRVGRIRSKSITA